MNSPGGSVVLILDYYHSSPRYENTDNLNPIHKLEFKLQEFALHS